MRFLSISFYHRFRTIKNCDEARRRGLKFSHNCSTNSKKNTNGKSFWHDEYDMLYGVNEPYLTVNSKDSKSFKTNKQH